MATIVNQVFNPISGIFGSGNVMIYAGSTAITGAQTATTFTWTVPAGVDAVRVRLWGGGGYNGGSAGGFAIKSIYGLSGTTSVLISVGFGGNATTVTGGTSSFGSFVSATGGANAGGAVGVGTGGDINTSGGLGAGGASGGGGCGSIFGSGASKQTAGVDAPKQSYGGAGAGQTNSGDKLGGPGFIGAGATANANVTTPLTQTPLSAPGSGLENFSIDFIGTGGGGTFLVNGRNGGGGSDGGVVVSGGIPGGGGGSTGLGGYGFVIVEW
jgi:hypothetical protein